MKTNLNNYRAIVDEPGNRFYKELMQFYPNAKVILTIRDFESWHASMLKTIIFATENLASHWLMRLINPKFINYCHECACDTFSGIDQFKNNIKQTKEIFDIIGTKK